MRWTFEPGHSAAQFRARHMMVTWVRGNFKDIHGTLDFDPESPSKLHVETAIDTTLCWTGESMRDTHLKSPDFLDCERYPTMRFVSTATKQIGATDYRVTGDLTIRDTTKPVILEVRHLGSWQTPWWEGGVDKGPKLRAGFVGKTQIDRYDFGVSWNGDLPGGGIVVSREVDIVLDVEAIRED